MAKRGERLSLHKEHIEKSRVNGYKLHWERFWLDVRHKCFTVRAIMLSAQKASSALVRTHLEYFFEL